MTATERQKLWRHANREKVRAFKRRWGVANREKVKEQKRHSYLRRREKERAKQKEYYAANREKLKSKVRSYYLQNKEEILSELRERYANDAEWRKAHQKKSKQWRDKGGYYLCQAKRRAVEIAAFVEDVDRFEVFRLHRGLCGICRKKINPDEKWHVDHIVPLSRGGVHSYDNVQPAHAKCNHSKWASLPKGQWNLFWKSNDVMGGSR